MVAAKIPTLELIQIASPCTADWDAMAGDDRTRFCGVCQLNVYNLSGMTRDQALTFLAERAGRTCVRMFKRSDGTVITADCPVGLAAVRQKLVRLMLATAGLVMALVVSALAAAGRLAGAEQLLATGKIERMRERYFPSVTSYGFMGDICPPTAVTPAPFVPPAGSAPPNPPSPAPPAE